MQQQGNMDGGGGGGRPANPTFWLSRNKYQTFLSFFMLLAIGMYFQDDPRRNIETLTDLLHANREVLGFTYMQDEIIALWNYITEQTDFLRRRLGRFPGLEIYFENFQPDLHRMLYANLEPDAPLELIFNNFRRIMGFAANHRDIFTAETTNPRVVTNMRALNANFHQIFPGTAVMPMATAAAAQAPGENAQRERVRIVPPVRRGEFLESGFAYMDARRIPLSNRECLGGPPRNLAHITSAPGFAKAFDRSLRMVGLPK